MTFEEQLDQYAEVVIGHGVNLQKGQALYINSDVVNRDFAMRLAEKAYRFGAKLVTVDLSDCRLGRLRVLHSSEENLDFVPDFVKRKYDEIVDTNAAVLRIEGSENPDILSGLDTKRLIRNRKAVRAAMQKYYDDGITNFGIQWSIAAAATPAWAKKVFPGLNEAEAVRWLWEAILKICRCDQPDALAKWKLHNQKLHERANRLNALKIKTLFFSGNETSLRVGLSGQTRFFGGSSESLKSVDFEPNIPTEEVFTTPDWRETNGVVRATRPFYISGTLVSDLEMKFEKGRITDFRASAGEAVFAEHIKTDPGACRLGEVALVGVDSPVFQSGLVFQETLFDENAACHIAVGNAYTFCIEGGKDLGKEKLAELGCNESIVHDDMMISSETVDVTAETYSGKQVLLIRKGAWAL